MILTCLGPVESNTESACGQLDHWAGYTKLEPRVPWVVPGCSELAALDEWIRRDAEQLASRLTA